MVGKNIVLLWMLGAAPLFSEMHEGVEELGYIEEEDEVASNDSRQRDDINFYEQNRKNVIERRRREAMREYRRSLQYQYCCPEEAPAVQQESDSPKE